MKEINTISLGKLARRAYFNAIDGRPPQSEWDSLSELEKDAWISVGFVVNQFGEFDEETIEKVLKVERKTINDKQTK